MKPGPMLCSQDEGTQQSALTDTIGSSIQQIFFRFLLMKQRTCLDGAPCTLRERGKYVTIQFYSPCSQGVPQGEDQHAGSCNLFSLESEVELSLE